MGENKVLTPQHTETGRLTDLNLKSGGLGGDPDFDDKILTRSTSWIWAAMSQRSLSNRTWRRRSSAACPPLQAGSYLLDLIFDVLLIRHTGDSH